METNKRVVVSESNATPQVKDEADWLKKWFKDEGMENVFGCKMKGTPKLVLNHVAGRVYLVKTEIEGDDHLCVVGNGRPSFYRSTSPEDILAYHRGRHLINRMDFKSNGDGSQTRP